MTMDNIFDARLSEKEHTQVNAKERTRQFKSGHVKINITSTFGSAKLSDILFRVAVDRMALTAGYSGRFAIDIARRLGYNYGQTEAETPIPRCSQSRR